MMRATIAGMSALLDILAPGQARAQRIDRVEGIPTSITDGDTFRLGATRVRLRGVDAPELRTRHGPAARAALSRLVGGRPVRCERSADRSYQRIVTTCINADGVDLGAAMVRSGWAIDWTRYSRGRYAADQAAAQRARVGVFAFGVEPWR